MALGMEIGLSPGECPPPQKVEEPPPNFLPISIVAKRLDGSRWPPFSAHIYCDQTAAWIKMPLGTEVGLGPDHIALDGDPALLT